MFRIMLRKQLMETFRSYFYNQKTGKKRSKAACIGLFMLFFLLIGVVIGGCMAALSFALCSALSPMGMEWLYFVSMGLIAIVLGTMGSAFTTYSGLYLGKDNDLLLSLPIPVKDIVLSRLTGVYLLGLIYSGIVTIPAAVVYWLLCGITVMKAAGGIMTILLVSFIVCALSCLLGWVVAKISVHLKRKSFLTVLVSLLSMGVYFLVVNRAQELLQKFLTVSLVLGQNIQQNIKPLYHFGMMGTGNLVSMLLCLAATALFCLLTWLLLSKTFLKLATATGKIAKAEYHEKNVKMKSVTAALTRREFRRFTSSAGYMLNCGLGSLFLILLGGALLVLGKMIIPMLTTVLGQKSGVIAAILCAVICAVGSMVYPATPSVSLEGKNLWLIRSLPVSSWQVLRAKLNVQLWLLMVPVAFCGIGLVVSMSFSAGSLLGLLLLLAFAWMFSLMAMAFGLRKPNLSWTNENTVIKQSVNVLFVLLIGWAYAGLLVLGCFLAPISVSVYLSIFILLTIGIGLLLLRWLKRRGCAILETL